LVKTLLKRVEKGSFATTLYWDGAADSGERMNPGVYIYRLKVSSEDGFLQAEKLQKLVILY